MPNAQMTPMSTMPSGSSRQRTLNSTSRISAMIADRDQRERRHAAGEVVVEVLEQHRARRWW